MNHLSYERCLSSLMVPTTHVPNYYPTASLGSQCWLSSLDAPLLLSLRAAVFQTSVLRTCSALVTDSLGNFIWSHIVPYASGSHMYSSSPNTICPDMYIQLLLCVSRGIANHILLETPAAFSFLFCNKRYPYSPFFYLTLIYNKSADNNLNYITNTSPLVNTFA